MNFLKIIFILSLLVFAVPSDLMAKKPAPSQDDKCSALEIFSPDFVFWRSSGGKNAPRVSIFLADSKSGCEKFLVEVSSSFSFIWSLRYSNSLDQDGNVKFGRVTWVEIAESPLGRNYGEAKAICLQDFNISGAEVVPDPGPKEIIFNASLDTQEAREDLSRVDLSPDMQSLVIDYSYESSVDPDGSYSSIRVIDIADCLTRCPSNKAPGLEFAKILRNETGWITAPSWGPFGTRIYAKWKIEGDETSDTIVYFDLDRDDDGNWVPPLDMDVLFSHDAHLDQLWMRAMAFPFSGIRQIEGGNKEFLAVHAEPMVDNESCENVYVIDVAACENPPYKCEAEPAFVGQFPTWTKNGEIIHLYEGWTLRGKCDFKQVGVWRGDDLKPLIEGKYPNAAGGIP